MRANGQISRDRELVTSMSTVAYVLSREGKEFNRYLLEQFQPWERLELEKMGAVAAMPPEHVLFYKAVAQTLGWLQQLPIPKERRENDLKNGLSLVPQIYFQVLLEARSGVVPGGVAKRLEELLGEAQEATRGKSPRRLLAVVAGLQTWAAVELPEVGLGGTLDLEETQRLALNACGRARWTALAPMKMYALCKGADFRTPRAILPPLGSAVSRGIERLFGFALGESESDYQLSRGLHLKLADLAHATIWDINSGLHRLGGGS
ncbi:MAG: hypothetical protein FJ012_01210 [Chloroflexi bacterium]|nr:hypothetical protein [Chloroflexota bacterium]